MGQIIALVAVSIAVLMIGIIISTPVVTVLGTLLLVATFVFMGIRDRIS